MPVLSEFFLWVYAPLFLSLLLCYLSFHLTLTIFLESGEILGFPALPSEAAPCALLVQRQLTSWSFFFRCCRLALSMNYSSSPTFKLFWG